MKKNSVIYKYKGQYPTRIWITSYDQSNLEDLADKFIFYKIFHKDMYNKERTREEAIECLKENVEGSDMFVDTVENVETKELGCLIVFSSTTLNLDNLVTHESCHVSDLIYEVCGLTNLDFSEGNENFAYLCGWIASCIWDASRKLNIKNEPSIK